MSYVGTWGKPHGVGEPGVLPSASELYLNVVKLSAKVAQKLLDKGRVSLDGTKVLIDGQPVYDRKTGRKGINANT